MLMRRYTAGLTRPLVWATAFFLFQLVLLTLALAKNFSSVPFWDMWNGGLEWYLDLSRDGFASYFAQHNEHRIPLTRLFIWLDYTFFHGLGVSLIVLNVLLALGIILTLLGAHKEENHPGLNSSKTAIALTVSAMFGLSWLQRENFSWAFQSQFYLAYLIPLLAFIAYSKSLKRSSIWFAVCLALAFISAFSMSNGLLVFPLLLVVSLLTRQTIQRIFAQSILCVAMLAIFFQNYNFNTTGTAPLSNLANDPIGVLKFFTLLLGSPGFFVFGKDYASAGIAGLMGVGVITLSIYLFSKEVKLVGFGVLKSPIFLFVLYSLASLFLISLGRSSLGLTQVFASRYCTPVLFLYVALLLLLLSKSPFSNIPGYVIAIFIIPFSLVQLNGFLTYQPEKQERNLAAIATALGIEDKEVTDRIWPFENSKDLAHRASLAKVSVFGRPPLLNLKTTIGVKVPTTSTACKLYIESKSDAQLNDGFLRIHGWLAKSREDTSDLVWLSFENGPVIGLGTPGNDRPDVRQFSVDYDHTQSFDAYALDNGVWRLGLQDLTCSKETKD